MKFPNKRQLCEHLNLEIFRARSLLLLLLLSLPRLQAQDNSQTPPASSPSTASTQTDGRDPNVYFGPSASGRSFLKKFAANVLLDQKDIWTSPFRINRSTAKWWLFAGAGTAVLLAVDHRASQALPFSGTSVAFGNNASRIGQWYTVFPAAGALYAAGLINGNEKLAETGALSLQALVGADITVNVMKVVARRQRPGDGDHGGHFEKGGSSFPSGHSTQAWALASVIADEYGDHRWVPYVSYGYASLVSVSRLLAQAHFTSDVFVGGAIGFFIGRYVVQTQREHRLHPHSTHARLFAPTVMPSFSPDSKTIALAWNY